MPALEESIFSNALIRLNDLDLAGFKRWLIKPGMDFGDQSSWWPPFRERPRPHEGMDFGLFRDNMGAEIPLSPKTRIPAAAAGRVAAVFEDLLGQSILLGHDDIRDGRRLYSIYAHTSPHQWVRPGQEVAAGTELSTLTAGSPRLPSHLHLSFCRLTENEAATITWPRLNTSGLAIFCDPRRCL